MSRAAHVALPDLELSAAASLFRGLSDPSRLALVQHLARGEHRVMDLVDHLGLAQSTVSEHLACLRDCGLVTVRPEGRSSWYSLSRPELFDLLAAAEAVLAATGERVTLCPAIHASAATPSSRPARGRPSVSAPRRRRGRAE
nr:metalloregulator ArsR/SmtB family transcription factor [Sporichthya polymorpha]